MNFPNSTFDVIAELNVLAYLIQTDSTNLFSLTEKDFYNHLHRKAFTEIKSGLKPSPHKLIELGLKEEYAWYVHETFISNYDAQQNAKNLRQMTAARKLWYDSQKNMEILNKATPGSLESIVGNVDISSRTYTASEAREKLKNEELALPIDFEPSTFCNLIEFFNVGWIGIIGASTGVGKTFTAIQIGRSIADYEHSMMMYFSLEMQLVAYYERCMSIDYYRNPDSDWNGWRNLRKHLTMETLMQWSIKENEIINDQPNIPISQMEQEIIKKKSQGLDVKTVVVDHFHIIGSEPSEKGATENQSQKKKIEDLSAMAKRQQVRVLLVCQTKKANGDNRNEEPYESDIRGAKEIPEQADWILMLWREKDNDYQVNYKLAKRRDGKGVGTKGKINVRGTYLYDDPTINFNPGNY